ncbi:hypothetical protein JTE90_022108 [Oedothorax gibbosus]|uniref:Uncharacterized protein n=1 Tax=Oedothorax gibbosus TaxID=931172 RepID=A0AAV6VV45_9ARAC|nr:hypothetical protein JTE90_022108 [Oedothorax gibbosus]
MGRSSDKKKKKANPFCLEQWRRDACWDAVGKSELGTEDIRRVNCAACVRKNEKKKELLFLTCIQRSSRDNTLVKMNCFPV